ncbi:MAG: methyl-accepting chemotaxis protein [Lachnospiraceae bacterium]
MKKSIGRKVLFLMGMLGVFLVLICYLNMAALSNVKGYNDGLSETFAQYNQAVQSGDSAQIEALKETYSNLVQHSNLRVSGTSTFNKILIGIIVVLMVIVIFVVRKTIANPAKDASVHLAGIVQKIGENRGDLTERIETKSKDEVGQLVDGINGFMDQLQSLMKKLQEESANMMLSVEEVTGQVDESNKSAMNVSAATQQLAASMEEVAATLDQISRGSAQILQQVQEIDQSAQDGTANVSDIRNRAKTMKAEAEQSKETAIAVFEEVGASLEQAVEDSRNVEQINALTGNILEISSRTNLLALNASIEAARAGEAGKGFAVVAEEIRTLADNSRETASSIQEISGMVTAAVNKLASEASKMLNFVNEDVVRDYGKFVEIIAQYEQDANDMNDMLVAFAGQATQMADTMKDMDQGISDIAVTVDESANAVSGVAEDATLLVNAISQIQQETANNQTISKELEGEVKRFEKV